MLTYTDNTDVAKTYTRSQNGLNTMRLQWHTRQNTTYKPDNEQARYEYVS